MTRTAFRTYAQKTTETRLPGTLPSGKRVTHRPNGTTGRLTQEKAASFGRRLNRVNDSRTEYNRAECRLAQGAQPKGPFPASAARILESFDLLAGTRELFHRVVALANCGGELFAKAFRRLTKVVAALGGSLGKRRIGKMCPISDPGPVFFELDLPLEIRGHLVEFANDPLEIFDLPRLFLDLAALQEHGRFT
jgi:hypothetical protein